ncbi:MAG: hypothetical protein KC413_21020, partial [Anaerolineales bacterium]|nr:hypothetical protein [Anaerolineales bacterium]
MSGILIPVALALAGLVTALAAYRGIRRGGARFYTLEREAMLRRAGFSLLISVMLFLASLSLLILERQQNLATDAAEAGETVDGVVTSTPTQVIQVFPPTATPIPTPDLSLPTPTVTPVVCRASIENTGGSGLTLRDAPGGNEVRILPEGTIVTLLDETATQTNNIAWRQV